MTNTGAEPLLLIIPLLLWLLGFYIFYWIIRLAVRHGVLDARRRWPDGHQDPGGRSGPS